MKKIQISLAVTCLATLVVGAMPSIASAFDEQGLDSPSTSAGIDRVLLAQSQTARAKQQLTKSKVNVDQAGVILHGYDAVAYFKQNKPVKGSTAYKSTYRGATYLFASAANKTEFDKNPAKYAPQYGGYCALSLSKGRLADIDPNNFVIYKGKLYVCTGVKELRSFKAHAEEDVVKDNNYWLQIFGS
jgi:YHS domain-containing protein